MRILMLAQFYQPIVGGEEQHVRTLGAALSARGHEVAVFTLWHPGLAEFEMDGQVRVYRARGTAQRFVGLYSEGGRRHAPPVPDPELVRALLGVLNREQPDIVHAHNWLVHSFLPLRALSKARLVLTLHDYSFVCAQKRLIYRAAPCAGPSPFKCIECSVAHYGWAKGVPTILGNWAMSAWERRAVDMFLAVSNVTAQANGLTGSELPFNIIPNFLPDDPGPLSHVNPVLDGLPVQDCILFVGDVTKDKGIDVLLRAYGQIQTPPPLVVIGRPGTDAPAESHPNVFFAGSLPHEAALEAMRRCSLVVVPSLVSETFGLVALEAMAMGAPVVASRIGGLQDFIVDGETGYLFPPGDAGALAQAITRVLKSPELRQALGQAGRRKSHEFRSDVVVPRIEAVYKEVLQENGARRQAAEPGEGQRAKEFGGQSRVG